jgi:hypothetical protein
VTASWITLAITSLGIIASALYLPSEGDYDLILDEQYIEQDDRCARFTYTSEHKTNVNRLLSRIAAWDNGWKGSNSSEEYSYQRDQDGVSIMSSIRGRRESDMSSVHDRRESDLNSISGVRDSSIARPRDAR